MQIVIEPVGSRFSGKLYVNNELIAEVIDQRPGCCARSLMNKLLLNYGRPTGQITMDITNWN